MALKSMGHILASSAVWAKGDQKKFYGSETERQSANFKADWQRQDYFF